MKTKASPVQTTARHTLNPQLKLETAVMNALGLIDLLTEELIRRREQEGDLLAGQCASGIMNLSHGTMCELRACYDVAFKEQCELRSQTERSAQ